ncbi:MAG: hypothetical protein U1E81_02070 [Xanthobacteraceae bacterium]
MKQTTIRGQAIGLTVALLIVSAPALLAHAPKMGEHGGPQADAGSFHVEIVANSAVLDVYLRDHSDKAVSTEGFRGAAIFVIDGKPERITLTPAGGNQLRGTSTVTIPPEPKGAVQITTPTGSTVQAKYN